MLEESLVHEKNFRESIKMLVVLPDEEQSSENDDSEFNTETQPILDKEHRDFAKANSRQRETAIYMN